MSDEETREVPLMDVMGIAEVADTVDADGISGDLDIADASDVSQMPTETLPVTADPGEAETESFQMPLDSGLADSAGSFDFDGSDGHAGGFARENTSESERKPQSESHFESAGRQKDDAPSAHAAEPAMFSGPIKSSKQVHVGKTNGDLVVRPSGPSAGTIVLGVFFCLAGLAAVACGVMPINLWKWLPNPSTMFFYGVGGLGALLLVISVIWAVTSAVRLRRQERQSAEQSPERQ